MSKLDLLEATEEAPKRFAFDLVSLATTRARRANDGDLTAWQIALLHSRDVRRLARWLYLLEVQKIDTTERMGTYLTSHVERVAERRKELKALEERERNFSGRAVQKKTLQRSTKFVRRKELQRKVAAQYRLLKGALFPRRARNQVLESYRLCAGRREISFAGIYRILLGMEEEPRSRESWRTTCDALVELRLLQKKIVKDNAIYISDGTLERCFDAHLTWLAGRVSGITPGDM